eukprot:3571620-Prymnesium_polylepis.1
MECQMWVCRIFDLMGTMQLDLQVSQLLANYKTQYSWLKERVEAGEKPDIAATAEKVAITREDVSQIVENTDLLGGIGIDLTPVLLDLTNYDYKPLVAAANSLLIQTSELRRRLYEAGCRVQLIVKDHMIQAYPRLKFALTRLEQRCASFPLTNQGLLSIIWLLGLFTNACYKHPTVSRNNDKVGRRPTFLALAGSATMIVADGM